MFREEAAPGGSCSDSETLVSISSGIARPPTESRHRLRRRGPRSRGSWLRRSTTNDVSKSLRNGAAVFAADDWHRSDIFLPTTLDDREPTSLSVVPCGFTLLLANTQGFVSKTMDLFCLQGRGDTDTHTSRSGAVQKPIQRGPFVQPEP